MKLIVFDEGDSSVGIFSRQFEIDCPFEKDYADDGELAFFKSRIEQLYAEFDSCSYAMYDFEIENMNSL